ncbi:MAG: antirestriction protein ArdA [Peptoniphilaceae bacterium]|nr:antirestriction protein ArdA [Peptoniphilaceae bacterium]
MLPLENLQVWLGDLAAYNAGRLVGKWYSFPLDEEKIREDFGESAEEIVPMDFEGFPSQLQSEYYSIAELNSIYQSLEELDSILLENIEDLMEAGYDLEDLERIETDFYYYEGCSNMADVAEEKILDGLWDVPDSLRGYLDYEAIGRTLETEGTYVSCDEGILELY